MYVWKNLWFTPYYVIQSNIKIILFKLELIIIINIFNSYTDSRDLQLR